MALSMDQIVVAVQEYAWANHHNGWDIIAEAFTDEDIVRELDREGVTTLEAAIDYFSEFCNLRHEVADDICNS